MNTGMDTAQVGTSSRAPLDVLSPDLALVDADLAKQARAQLPASPDTLSRLETPTTRARAQSVRATPLRVDHFDIDRIARELASHRRQASIALGVAAVLAWGVLALIGRSDSPEASRLVQGANDAPIAAVGTLPPTPRTPRKPRTTVSGPEAGTPQRFVWAPDSDATSYEVEIFRGDKVVFKRRTPNTFVEVPRSWRLQGRLERLTPGHYRWYVWAFVGDLRRSSAIVQSTIRVR